LVRLLDTVETHGSPLLLFVFVVALIATLAMCLLVLLSTFRSGLK
jgi:hypothetical protein